MIVSVLELRMRLKIIVTAKGLYNPVAVEKKLKNQ